MKTLKSMYKLIAFTTLVIFLGHLMLINPSFAQDQNRSFWQKRQKSIQGTTEDKTPEVSKPEAIAEVTPEPIKVTSSENSIDPESIRIPTQYGSIIETHKGTNGKLILHIQDAHANHEGQRNIAHILEALIEDYKVNLVLREAESTNANFSHLRERASLVARAMAAEKLLKDATIAGEDYVDITSNYDISFEGIEDEVLYEANKSKLWEIDEFKDLAAEYVNKMTLASNALKGQVYSDELRAIDSKKRAYEDEKIDLVTYYEYLYEKAQENEIPMYTFPNFANLVKARQIEKKMNLPEEDTENAGSQAELYMEYRKLTQDLNINDLFKEEPILEDLVKEYTATNSDQKKLIRISKALSILSNLLRIKVVPEEYQYFQEHKSDFDPQFWMDFLNKKSQELSLSLALPNNFYIITDNLNTIEQFYHIADERNKAFLENTNKHIKKHNTEIAVLKAGGFHTPRLTALLAENGYSYIVISPKVTTKTDEALYRSTLKRK